MTWEIALGIFALVGGIATIVKPMIDLTKSISALTVIVDEFRHDLDEQRTRSKNAHERLWKHNEEQDEKIQDHELRIHSLEIKE